MSNILTSSKFINSVRTRAMIPEDTTVYSDADILDVANEQISTHLAPKLLSINEGYLLVSTSVDIVQGKTNYKIPYRALANKLKEVSINDTSDVTIELSQIDVGNLPDYNRNLYGTYQNVFYVKGNEIVLVGNVDFTYKNLTMWYYLRPSALVEEDLGATISSIDTLTGTIELSNFPDSFASNPKIDFISHKNPNNLLKFDVDVVSSNQNTLVINISPDDIPEDLEVGDYVCKAGETIVPQVPLELHPVLAQSVAVHILEALGDLNALEKATQRLETMTTNVLGMFNERIEEAPRKIVSRHNPLREAIFRGQYRRNRRS